MPLNIIILQPVSSKDKLQHYLATVKAPVDINRIKKHFEANLLIALYRHKQIHVWGNTHDTKGTNARKWEEIAPGDIMLFSGKGKFFASATVLSKIHSENLSLDLWGKDKKGKTREYIYFLDDVKDQNITYADFNNVVGNTPGFIIRTFSVLDVEKSLLVFNAFGLKKDIAEDEDVQELLETGDNTKTQERQIHEEEMPESNVGNAEAIAGEWFLKACRYDRLDPCSDKAMDAYIKCLRYDDKHIDAYMNLGLIYLAKKDYEETLNCFQKIIKLEPHNPEAIKTLNYVYEKMDGIVLAELTDSRGDIKSVARPGIPKTTILVVILALLIGGGGYFINSDLLLRLYSKIYHRKTTSKPVSEKTTSKPVSEKTTSKPVSEKTTSTPVSKETTSKLVSKKTTSTPFSEKTTSAPVSKKTTSAPVSGKTTSKLVSKKTTDMQKTIPQKLPEKDIKFDFRNIRWGMTKEQVKASETMEIVFEKETAILYRGGVEGMENTVYYTFKEKRLLGCMQRFIGKHTDDNSYIRYYKKIKEALTHKYGPPVTDQQRWSDDKYKDSPQDWGFAVRSGDLFFRSSWESKYTEIDLGLYSINNKIIHAVFYTNKEFKSDILW